MHVTMEIFNISNQPSVRFTNLFYLDEQESEGGESDDPVCTTSPDGDWLEAVDSVAEFGVFDDELSDICRIVEQLLGVEL